VILAAVITVTFPAARGEVPDHRRPVVQDNSLGALSIASFAGVAGDSIQAVARDASGNVYVAGTTFSAQFPVKNAEQPVFGDAALLRSVDLGVTWRRATNPPGGANSLTVDPVTPQVIFASGPQGLFKSTDSGESWKAVNAASGNVAIDPGNHLRVAMLTSAGVIRSLDGGATWTGGGTCGFVTGCYGQLVPDPSGSGTLLAVTGETTYFSRDWGVTFQALDAGDTTAAAFDPTRPGRIYLGASAGVFSFVFLSTDNGVTWMQEASPPGGGDISYMAVSPDPPGTLIANTLRGFYQSSDGAMTWTPQTSSTATNFNPASDEPFGVVPKGCSATGGIVALGSGRPGTQAVAFSPDFGITWATPQLTQVSSVAAGVNCTLYATRATTSDAFVAKIAPNGDVLWATYLGGSDQDAAVALALDPQGNVYVAGNTSSIDFPVSTPHIGPAGQNSVFVTKFSPNGEMSYSATLGGEATNTAVALAVDAGQNAYVAGSTNSHQFPVTAGTVGKSLDAYSYTGFVAKLSANAGLSYATYLGNAYTFPDAILVDANEDVIVGGTGTVPGTPAGPAGNAPQFVMKLDSAASQVVTSTYLAGIVGGGITGLAADAQNNLVVLGTASTGSVHATPGAFTSPPAVTLCNLPAPFGDFADAYVMKLNPETWQPAYIAVMSTACGIQPGALAIDQTGASVFALTAGSGFPLRSPLFGGTACGPLSSAIAKLSADGSTLQFATFLDNCDVPGMALGADGSVYAGVSPLRTSGTMSVLHFNTNKAAAISLNGISNAFSGDASAVVFGGLYSLAVSGFEPAAMNLGFNPSKDLPTELSGVQVTFDGVPAAILATGPGQIIVTPAPVVTRAGEVANRGNAPITTLVQVRFNGVESNPVWMPVADVLPGLLTVDYPNVLPHAFFADAADAKALNQDGTVNDVNHPAAAGSTITLFATGMGVTNPIAAPGSVAKSDAVSPVGAVYSSSDPLGAGEMPAPLTVSTVPGLISALFQVQFPNVARGTEDVGNGVTRVELGLTVNLAPVMFALSNVVAVYVK
jgi:uncharacterized protein (TIGR03437 family)